MGWDKGKGEGGLPSYFLIQEIEMSKRNSGRKEYDGNATKRDIIFKHPTRGFLYISNQYPLMMKLPDALQYLELEEAFIKTLNKKDNLFDIVKSESSRLRDINSKDPLRNLLLSFMAYEYAILLSTSANFRGRDFLLKYKELAELEWLLEYDNARAVRKIKILKRFVPNIFIPMILHIYAKYYVNKL